VRLRSARKMSHALSTGTPLASKASRSTRSSGVPRVTSSRRAVRAFAATGEIRSTARTGRAS